MRLLLTARAVRPPLRLAVTNRNHRVFTGKTRAQLRDRPSLRHAWIEPRLVGLQPDPLRPLVVVGIDRREFARPVVHKSEALQLSTEVVDRLLGGDLGMHTSLDRVLLGGKPECVPAHRMKHIEALELLVSANDVGGGVALRMSDMQARARWIREHVEAVELRLRRVEPRLARIGLSKSVALAVRPTQRILPLRLDGVGVRGRIAVRDFVGFDDRRCGHRWAIVKRRGVAAALLL